MNPKERLGDPYVIAGAGRASEELSAEESRPGAKPEIRTQQGQVDPCSELAVRFGSGQRSFSSGKQRLALATSGSWLSRRPCSSLEFRNKQRDSP